MSPERPILVTEQLSRSERRDLLDHLPPGAAEERIVPLPPGELGEAATAVMLLAVTPTVLAGISAWLTTRGKNVETRFSLKAPGISGELHFTARSGDTADDLTKLMNEKGVDVPPD